MFAENFSCGKGQELVVEVLWIAIAPAGAWHSKEPGLFAQTGEQFAANDEFHDEVNALWILKRAKELDHEWMIQVEENPPFILGVHCWEQIVCGCTTSGTAVKTRTCSAVRPDLNMAPVVMPRHVVLSD